MIFIDESNFFEDMICIKFEKGQDRIIDYWKINNFLIDYLSDIIPYKKEKLFPIRMYLYVGEYTHTLIKRINSEIFRVPISEKEKLKRLLDNVKKRINDQKKKLERIESSHYMEPRKKPLQFTREKGIFQKGVDVQIAADLISNAYMDNYDIAVLFSGDVDLLESIKLVKSLGKQVIIFSHLKNTAVEMRKLADMYVNIQNLNDFQLDRFSHIFDK